MSAFVQEMYSKLQHELALAEEKLKKSQQQGKLLEGERKVLDKGIAKATNSIKVSRSISPIAWAGKRREMTVAARQP